MSSTKTWFVYLIECSDGSLYTGITVDLAARFAAHSEGRGARSMRMHAPVRMLAAEAHPDRSAASKAEYRIKQLTAAQKRAYVATMTPDPMGSPS
ncbi:MAG: GIY-YIG nuclease family protein [Rhodocyclales bacterium]|nr:GIY-YIG nuclease family protein [Rhodocyclales bacterium]